MVQSIAHSFKTQILAMIEILIQNPDKNFQFDDDIEIPSMLLELGVAGRFSKNPPNIPHGNASTQAVFYGEHPTHFILIILYLGHPSQKDNGYFVQCLPKSKMSYAQFMEFAKGMLKPTDDGIVGSNLFWTGSSDN
jgi:hypothetical protein